MSYDEGRWRILPFEQAAPLGSPVLDHGDVALEPDVHVRPGYLLAHLPALSSDSGVARFLRAEDGAGDADPTLAEDRALAARVGFRFRAPLQPDAVPFRSVGRCETAIFVEGRGWLGCHPRREGVCLGWSPEPRWEWAMECLHASDCGDTVLTGSDLRLWNQEAEDFLVFDAGELGPALRWLTDYQRLLRMTVGSAPAESRLTGAGV